MSRARRALDGVEEEDIRDHIDRDQISKRLGDESELCAS